MCEITTTEDQITEQVDTQLHNGFFAGLLQALLTFSASLVTAALASHAHDHQAAPSDTSESPENVPPADDFKPATGIPVASDSTVRPLKLVSVDDTENGDEATDYQDAPVVGEVETTEADDDEPIEIRRARELLSPIAYSLETIAETKELLPQTQPQVSGPQLQDEFVDAVAPAVVQDDILVTGQSEDKTQKPTTLDGQLQQLPTQAEVPQSFAQTTEHIPSQTVLQQESSEELRRETLQPKQQIVPESSPLIDTQTRATITQVSTEQLQPEVDVGISERQKTLPKAEEQLIQHVTSQSVATLETQAVKEEGGPFSQPEAHTVQPSQLTQKVAEQVCLATTTQEANVTNTSEPVIVEPIIEKGKKATVKQLDQLTALHTDIMTVQQSNAASENTCQPIVQVDIPSKQIATSEQVTAEQSTVIEPLVTKSVKGAEETVPGTSVKDEIQATQKESSTTVTEKIQTTAVETIAVVEPLNVKCEKGTAQTVPQPEAVIVEPTIEKKTKAVIENVPQSSAILDSDPGAKDITLPQEAQRKTDDTLPDATGAETTVAVEPLVKKSEKPTEETIPQTSLKAEIIASRDISIAIVEPVIEKSKKVIAQDIPQSSAILDSDPGAKDVTLSQEVQRKTDDTLPDATCAETTVAVEPLIKESEKPTVMETIPQTSLKAEITASSDISTAIVEPVIEKSKKEIVQDIPQSAVIQQIGEATSTIQPEKESTAGGAITETIQPIPTEAPAVAEPLIVKCEKETAQTIPQPVAAEVERDTITVADVAAPLSQPLVPAESVQHIVETCQTEKETVVVEPLIQKSTKVAASQAEMPRKIEQQEQHAVQEQVSTPEPVLTSQPKQQQVADVKLPDKIEEPSSEQTAVVETIIEKCKKSTPPLKTDVTQPLPQKAVEGIAEAPLPELTEKEPTKDKESRPPVSDESREVLAGNKSTDSPLENEPVPIEAIIEKSRKPNAGPAANSGLLTSSDDVPVEKKDTLQVSEEQASVAVSTTPPRIEETAQFRESVADVEGPSDSKQMQPDRELQQRRDDEKQVPGVVHVTNEGDEKKTIEKSMQQETAFDITQPSEVICEKPFPSEEGKFSEGNKDIQFSEQSQQDPKKQTPETSVKISENGTLPNGNIAKGKLAALSPEQTSDKPSSIEHKHEQQSDSGDRCEQNLPLEPTLIEEITDSRVKLNAAVGDNSGLKAILGELNEPEEDVERVPTPVPVKARKSVTFGPVEEFLLKQTEEPSQEEQGETREQTFDEDSCLDDDEWEWEELVFSGEYTKAMSKDWHSGHFCCWQCDETLTGQRYVLRDDHPYCIRCYESVFANVCEECNKVIGIDSKDLSYKDKHWHEACFLCTKCHVSLVDKQFGSKSDKIYCGNCYDAQFASRCDGCGEIFRAGTKKMEYKTRQWHEKCFCCVVCKTPIGTKSFIPREQEIFCATCYEEKFATRCVKCNKIITTGGVTYKNEPWHRECFTCTNCNSSLAGQRFTSRDEKPYCAECFGELFAKRCTACSKPITGIGGTRFISFEDRHWHNDCFICASCKTSLVGRGFITDGPDIICPECAKQKLM